MRIDLRLLEVFCQVYEKKSFSKAADALYLSQPTVSSHVKNLEDLLGLRLFDRLPRKVRPTAAGRILYRHGRAIDGHREAALQELKLLVNRLGGWLRIYSSTIPGEYLLPPLLSSFRKIYPDVRVDLRIMDSEGVYQKLQSGESELGFVGAKIESASLEFHRFARDEMALVVPNNPEWREVESITVEELASKPFLARERGSGTRLMLERIIGRDLKGFNLVALLGSTNSVKESLKAGLGVSVLSLHAVRSELEAGLLKTVRVGQHETFQREFYALTNPDLTLSPLAECFISHALRTDALVSR